MPRKKAKAAKSDNATSENGTSENGSAQVETAAPDPAEAQEQPANGSDATPPEAAREPEPVMATASAPAVETEGDYEHPISRHLNVNDLFLAPPAATADQRERQAAADFQAAIAPALEQLRASVPDASSPEEAARIWEERQGEPLPDPGGVSIRDIYNNDTSVFYRIRRHFERPRNRWEPWRPPAGLAQPTRQTYDK